MSRTRFLILLSMAIRSLSVFPVSAEDVLEAPKLELEVPVGGKTLTKITLEERGDHRVRFLATIQEKPANDLVEVSFTDRRDQIRNKSIFEFSTDQDSPLYLRAEADPNLNAGNRLKALVRLDKLLPGENGRAHSITIPVEMSIVPPRNWNLMFFIVLTVLTVSFLFYSRLWKSRFLPKADALASSINPTIWFMGDPTTSMGKDQKRQEKQHIRRLIESELGSKWKRCILWLVQNPFVVALPGHEYRELLELHLGDGAQRLTVNLLGKRNAEKYLEHVKSTRGRLFVIADKARGFTFLVRRGSKPMIGPFSMEGREDKKGLRLVKRTESEEDGQAAGWRIVGTIKYI